MGKVWQKYYYGTRRIIAFAGNLVSDVISGSFRCTVQGENS
jgi:hypothetical protein